MKINKVKIKKNKLFKLFLVKFRLYISSNITNVYSFIDQIEFKIKQFFKIIYKYHCSKKTILFIGFSDKLIFKYNKILKFTNHYYMSKNLWVNGLISNSKIIGKLNKNFLIYNNILDLLLKKKPDLVVILDCNCDEEILNEINYSKIPVVRVDLLFKKFNNINNLKFLREFFFNEFINIVIVIIFSLLKKRVKTNFDILFKINLKKNIYKKSKLFFRKK